MQHSPDTRPLTSELLDALAHVVATALDEGEEHRAWALTRTLEEIAGTGGDLDQPPRPVIGRRFARAHRRLLAQASNTSRRADCPA